MSEPLLFDPLLAHLRRALNGDKREAEALVRKISPKLFGAAFRILQNANDAEEIVQEALIKLWKTGPDWKTGRALIETWAYRVVMNLCFDRLKSQKRYVYDEADENLPDNAQSAENALMFQEISNEIDRALLSLPPRQRAVIVLTYFEGLGGKEAAAALETSVEAVESLLARAKKFLRAELTNSEPEILNQFAAFGAA